ncbi:hypothetical protein ABZ703_29000, partial [Streptomyces massasporeus]
SDHGPAALGSAPLLDTLMLWRHGSPGVRDRYLVVNQLTLGPAGTTTLPRPGIYTGHAWWTGRQAASDYYDQNIRGGVRQPMTTEEVGRAREQSPVTEQYTVDLWFLRECEPEDEEE